MKFQLNISIEHPDLWNALLELAGGNVAQASFCKDDVFKDGAVVDVDYSLIPKMSRHFHATGLIAIATNLQYMMEELRKQKEEQPAEGSKIILLNKDNHTPN